MVKFRFSPGRALTGAVAAAALTAFAAGASAQMSQQDMQQRQQMMQNQQQMQGRSQAEMQERMRQGMPDAQRGMMPHPGAMQQSGDRMGTMQQRRAMQEGAVGRQMGAAPGAAGASSIQERVQNWNMDRYVALQQAVAAHQHCRAALSEPAMRAVISRIEARAGEPASPGRKLAIQDDAQFHMQEIVRVEGCAAPRVKKALSVFDDMLAPAAHEAVAAMPE